jgi:hypothetical protein
VLALDSRKSLVDPEAMRVLKKNRISGVPPTAKTLRLAEGSKPSKIADKSEFAIQQPD